MTRVLCLVTVCGCTAEPARLTDSGPPPDMAVPIFQPQIDATVLVDAAIDMLPEDMGLLCAEAEGETVWQLVILHSGAGASALFEDTGRGGIARFVTQMKALRADAEGPVITLASGGTILAGETFAAARHAGLPFLGALGMAAAGFDAVHLGRRDLDFGPEVWTDFMRSVGEGPVFLGADLDPALPRSTVLTVDEHRIAVIGVQDALAVEVNASDAEVHVLITETTDAEALNTLVAGSRGLAVVVAAGVEQAAYPRSICDAEGQLVRVVTVAGEYTQIGKLTLNLNADNQVVGVEPDSALVAVSAQPDPEVQRTVLEPLRANLAAMEARIIGRSAVALEGRRGPIRSSETNLGNLVADALLWQGGILNPDAPPVLALVSADSLRINRRIPPGVLTERDSHAILSAPHFLTAGAVSRVALKTVIEAGLAQVVEGGEGFLQVAGLRLRWNAHNATVETLTLTDGTPLIEAGEVVRGDRVLVVATTAVALDLAPTTHSVQAAFLDYVDGALDGRISAAQYPQGGQRRSVAQ